MTGVAARWVLRTAGVLLALATIAGALGRAHAEGHLSASRLDVYDTAVRYQFYHSLGLLLLGYSGLHPAISRRPSG